jgi:DNA polymerase alpha subunit A
MERTLFFALRPLIPPDNDVVRQHTACQTEVLALLSKFGIKRKRAKFVQKKRCFQLTAEDVNASDEATYLKVLYSFQEKALPKDLTGVTFSCVYGTHSTALELFLLHHRLKGPSWIQVQARRNCESTRFSWCHYEYEASHVDDFQNIDQAVATAILKILPPPPLSVMAISLKTYINTLTQRHDIAMISYVAHSSVCTLSIVKLIFLFISIPI